MTLEDRLDKIEARQIELLNKVSKIVAVFETKVDQKALSTRAKGKVNSWKQKHKMELLGNGKITESPRRR